MGEHSRLDKALVGTTLADRYRLDRVVGSGGFGVVFAGHHMRLDVPVAVKVLHVEHESAVAQRRTVERFVQEAKTLAQLRHPHIARVLDTGTRDADEALPALSYLVLEWCEGPTLSQHLFIGGAPSREACWRLFRPIVDAVAYAHEQNVVHRDLKPDNIILVDGSPRVLDFGIAKVMEAGEESPASTSTRSEQRAFTPAYAAPEQIAGTRTGPWTDVHALGLVFTELVVGTRPYASTEGADLYREVLADERPTPRRHGVDAGPWEHVIERALHTDPAERYQNAGQLLKALDRTAPILDTVAAEDDDTAIDVTSRPPPQITTPMPPSAVVAPQSAARTETLEPATTERSASWRSSSRLLAAIAAAALAWGMYRFATHRADTPVTRENVVSSAAPTLSSVPQPVPVTRHPVDGYDVELIVRRLEARGWTIVDKRLHERDFISDKSRINIQKGDTRGFVSVQRWSQAQHMRAAVSYLEPLEGRMHKKRSCLLYVHVTGDRAASERLLEALGAGGEAPLTAPVAIDGSSWRRIPVPTRAVLRAIWSDARGTLVIAGHHGVLLRRDAAGWTTEETGTTDDLYDVWGRSADDLFAVGERGTIIHRSSGRWSAEPSGLAGDILAVGGNRERTVAVSLLSLIERIDGTWTRFDNDPDEMKKLANVVFADDVGVSVIDAHDQPKIYRSEAPDRWIRAGAWPESDGAPWPFLRLEQKVLAGSGEAWASYANDHALQPMAFARFAGELMLVGQRGMALRIDPSLIATAEQTGVDADLFDVLREGDGTFFAVGSDGVVLERRP